MKARGYYSKSPILFPNQLLNTAISGERLSVTKDFRYAQVLLNMIPSVGRAGIGSKRFGTKEYITTGTGEGNIIKMFKIKPDGKDNELLVFTDLGKLLRWRNDAWEVIKDGLDTNSVPDSVHYNEKLIIFNGVDDNLVYDGETVSIIESYVLDQVNNPTINKIVDVYRASIDTLFPEKYEIGTKVRVKSSLGDGTETVTETTVTAVNKTPIADSDRTTVTLDFPINTIPDLTENILELSYMDKPLPFKYMFVQYFRLWALAGEDMKAYYTEFTNNENGWFNKATQSVPYINMENNYPFNDDLQAIKAIDGQMLFIGKKHTQIWTGKIPVKDGDFTFRKAIPTGCVDGRLTQHFPQSLVVTTEYGIRDFKTAAINNNLEISPDIGTNIDPTIQDAIASTLNDPALLKDARSFVYTRDGMYGFKLAGQVLIYILSDKTKGWTTFSGDFTESKDFLEFDTQLLLTNGDKVLVYTNSAKGNEESYSDRGSAIRTLWRTPFLEPKRRFSNIYTELLLERNLPSQQITVRRYMDNNFSNFKSKDVNINTQQGRWDVDAWDITLWDFSKENRALIKDKFVANAASFEIDTNHTEPFAIAGFNLLGGS